MSVFRLTSRCAVLLPVILIVASIAACDETSPTEPVGAGGGGGSGPPVQPTIAELVLTGGRFYTVDDTQPWAEAIAIQDDRIVHVGDDATVQQHVDDATKVVNLEGRLVLPGFIDTHAHPLQGAGLSYAELLEPGLSEEQVVNAMLQNANANPALPIVLGFGFSEELFVPDGPRKEALDAAIPDRPVVIIDSGGHSAWVNSNALELFGIDKDTPDPIPGKHFYQRDEDGTPTGWLVESQTFNPPLAEFGAFDTDTVMDDDNFIYSLIQSAGITTVFDAGASSFETMALEAASQLAREGRLPFRLVASHMIQNPNQLPGAIERFRELQERYNEGRLHVGMIKVHNDGTIEARTAAFLEPYLDTQGSAGDVLLEPSTLNPFVAEADAAGIDLHIHAIGDRTVREALDAVEQARLSNPNAETRHTLVHIEQIADEDVSRFAELNVIASTTSYWVSLVDETGDVALGAERFEHYYRFRELLDGGARVTFGSDFPATGGPVFAVGPLWGIEVGHTRQPTGEPDAPILGGPEERLTLEEMIRGYTLDAAYQLRMEDDIGSIEVGKLADLVVLSRDIFEIPPHEIHQVRVETSLIGGEVQLGNLPN